MHQSLSPLAHSRYTRMINITDVLSLLLLSLALSPHPLNIIIGMMGMPLTLILSLVLLFTLILFVSHALNTYVIYFFSLYYILSLLIPACILLMLLQMPCIRIYNYGSLLYPPLSVRPHLETLFDNSLLNLVILFDNLVILIPLINLVILLPSPLFHLVHYSPQPVL